MEIITLDLNGVDLIMSADIYRIVQYCGVYYPAMTIRLISPVDNIYYCRSDEPVMSYDDISKVVEFLDKCVNNSFDSTGIKSISVDSEYIEFSVEVYKRFDDSGYDTGILYLKIQPYTIHNYSTINDVGSTRNYCFINFTVTIPKSDDITKLYRFFKNILGMYNQTKFINASCK